VQKSLMWTVALAKSWEAHSRLEVSQKRFTLKLHSKA
jgi:hypothetical protein